MVIGGRSSRPPEWGKSRFGTGSVAAGDVRTGAAPLVKTTEVSVDQ